jgi:hypothetical protein
MWYIYTIEFYSATKKNEIMSFAGKRMELETIMLSEISQSYKDKYHMFSPICGRKWETKQNEGGESKKKTLGRCKGRREMEEVR